MKKRITWAGLLLALAPVVCGQSLLLGSPNGGENWFIGQKRAITWQATEISVPVTLVLRRDGVRVGIIAAGLPAAQGSYTWTVGTLLEGGAVPVGGGYSVRVRSEDNQAGDASDQSFRISQLTRMEGSPGSLQPLSEAHPTHPQLTILPDLFLKDFYYKQAQKTFQIEIDNLSPARYVGPARIRMVKEDPGCPSQEISTYFPDFTRDKHYVMQVFPCDVFGTPCRQRIRVELLLEAPEANTANNVFDAMVPLHRVVNHRVSEDGPIRLRFSHGSKTLRRDYYVYGPENTITRNDVLNDYDPQTRRATFFVDVPVVNCGGHSGNGYIHYRVTWRQGSSSELLASGPLWDAPVGLEPGQGRQVSRFLDLPVRRGEYYVNFRGNLEPTQMGTVTFRFSNEFFD